MSPIVSPARSHESFPRPRLRLLRGNGEPRPEGLPTSDGGRPELHALGGERASAPAVLLAGADAASRLRLRGELSGAVSRQTIFVEANTAAEVLERAVASRLVMLAGDLEDLGVEAMIRLLAQHHPRLSVMRLDTSLPAVAGARS